MKSNENEQTITVNKKQLYCAMLQLACLHQDAHKRRVAQPHGGCSVCKVNPHMLDENVCCDAFTHTATLARSVGVYIGPVGFNEEYAVHLDK